MKKTVNFRFATGTLDQLERLAEGSTRTAVLERLIAEAYEPCVPVAKVPASEVSGLLTGDLVPKVRQSTTLTGRPHGPIPKGKK